MTAILQADSTLTDRYQTTVPEPVRRALGLRKRDAIHYEVLADGEVRLTKGGQHNDDPVVASFLGLLEADMKSGRNVSPVNADLVAQLRKLVAGADVDLDAPLDPADE